MRFSVLGAVAVAAMIMLSRNNASAQTIAGSSLPQATSSPGDVLLGIHGGLGGVGGTTSKFPVGSLGATLTSLNVPYAFSNCVGGTIVPTCTPYGAVGDGATDDSAAINAALAAASAIGGVVSLKPATYAIASTLVDNDASVVCQGGGTYGNVYNSCHLKWIGATGGTMFNITPPSGQTTTRGLLFSQIGFDGNNESAAICLSTGSAFSNFINLQLTNCSKYEILVAGSQTSYAPALHNHFDNIICQNYYMSDCVHVGLKANNEGGTQNEFDNMGLQYGATGRGIVFDYADENTVKNMSTYVVAVTPTSLTNPYTASYSPTTITVGSTALYNANGVAFINGFGFLYVNSIISGTQMVVTYASQSGVGNTAGSGTSVTNYGDGVAFLAAASYNVIDTCTGCFVHSYNQTSFQTYPVNNTARDIDHGDNGIPLPVVEPFSLLTYQADSGIKGFGADYQHITCAVYKDCLYLQDGLLSTTRSTTTSEYNVNSTGDNIRLDNGNGSVASIGFSPASNPSGPNTLQVGCVAGACSSFNIGMPIRLGSSPSSINAGNNAFIDYGFSVPNQVSISSNAQISAGLLRLGQYNTPGSPQVVVASGQYNYGPFNGIILNGIAFLTQVNGASSQFLGGFDNSGNLEIQGQLSETPATPADNATCTAGKIWVDASYIYVCTATNTVKRAALSTF